MFIFTSLYVKVGHLLAALTAMEVSENATANNKEPRLRFFIRGISFGRIWPCLPSRPIQYRWQAQGADKCSTYGLRRTAPNQAKDGLNGPSGRVLFRASPRKFSCHPERSEVEAFAGRLSPAPKSRAERGSHERSEGPMHFCIDVYSSRTT